MMLTIVLMQCGQKGATVGEVQNREVHFRMVNQPGWRIEKPNNICLKQIASYGGFGHHVEGTKIRGVQETVLPTIFYNDGFSGMRRKRQYVSFIQYLEHSK